MKTEQIYEHLERISNLLRTDTRKAGLAKGMQPVQLEALHYLSCCNRYSNTPAAVADYLGLTKGTVSQTLGLLETWGLIEKKPDQKDRRVVHLMVTEKGERALLETIPPQALINAVESLSLNDQDLLLEALNGILRAMQRANQLRTFGVCMSCRHHGIDADANHHCQLTGESLLLSDIRKICREHEIPEQLD